MLESKLLPSAFLFLLVLGYALRWLHWIMEARFATGISAELLFRSFL